MKVKNGTFSKIEIAETKKQLEEKRFNSNLSCFNSHNGIRPGHFSTIIAPSGQGKSTLVRTLIYEIIASMKGVYVLLSEEDINFYSYPIYKIFEKSSGQDRANWFMQKAFFSSMVDWEHKDRRLDKFLSHLEDQIDNYEMDIECIIFDNYTTSFLSSLPPNKQEYVIDCMRDLAIKRDIAFVCVSHTGKGTNIHNSLVSTEDVRGNAKMTNTGSYNYILQTFFRLDIPRSFIYIQKARGFSSVNGAYYEVFFDKELEIYTYDRRTKPEVLEAIQIHIKKQKANISIDYEQKQSVYRRN